MAILQKTEEADNISWRLGFFLLIALAALLLLGSIKRTKSQACDARDERARATAESVVRNLDSAWRQKAADSPITALEMSCR